MVYQWFAVSMLLSAFVALLALLVGIRIRTLLGLAVLIGGWLLVANGALWLSWDYLFRDWGYQIVVLLESATVGLTRQEEQMYLGGGVIVVALVLLIAGMAGAQAKK